MSAIKSDDLQGIARDYLGLNAPGFVLKYGISKTDFDEKLKDNVDLNEEFDECLEVAFSEKTRRDLFVTISDTMDKLRSGEQDLDERRLLQQLLQSMVAMKKALQDTKKSKGGVSDLLSELG
jgi:hypothetical protein